jgi:hypothetical protein
MPEKASINKSPFWRYFTHISFKQARRETLTCFLQKTPTIII